MILLLSLLNKSGLKLERKQFQDCGLLIYKDDQPVQSGQVVQVVQPQFYMDIY